MHTYYDKLTAQIIELVQKNCDLVDVTKDNLLKILEETFFDRDALLETIESLNSEIEELEDALEMYREEDSFR